MDDAGWMGKHGKQAKNQAGDTLDPRANTSHTQHDILCSEYCPDFGS